MNGLMWMKWIKGINEYWPTSKEWGRMVISWWKSPANSTFMLKKDLLKRCWIKWATSSILFCGVFWPLSVDSCCLVFIERDLFCTSATPGRRLDSSGNCINSFCRFSKLSMNYFSVIKDATTQKHNVLWNGRWSLCPPSPAAFFVIREEIGP